MDALAAARLAGRVAELQRVTQGALGPSLGSMRAGAWTGGAAPAFVSAMEGQQRELRAALASAVAAADGFATDVRVAEQRAAEQQAAEQRAETERRERERREQAGAGG